MSNNGQVLTPGSDSDYNFDFDPKTGFPRKKTLKVYNNGNGTSDDEATSAAGSPCVSRRRLGSFNDKGESGSRDDKISPDITPNGTLRRRKSRVLSEEDEGNLMDFLRASGHDTNRERGSKSWGSLGTLNINNLTTS